MDPRLRNETDNLAYIGIVKSDSILDNLKYCILIFSLLTFQKIVKLKMKFYRAKMRLDVPFYSTLFEGITWRELDIDFLHFIKYLANYFFYRFGVEVGSTKGNCSDLDFDYR